MIDKNPTYDNIVEAVRGKSIGEINIIIDNNGWEEIADNIRGIRKEL